MVLLRCGIFESVRGALGYWPGAPAIVERVPLVQGAEYVPGGARNCARQRQQRELKCTRHGFASRAFQFAAVAGLASFAEGGSSGTAMYAGSISPVIDRIQIAMALISSSASLMPSW